MREKTLEQGAKLARWRQRLLGGTGDYLSLDSGGLNPSTKSVALVVGLVSACFVSCASSGQNETMVLPTDVITSKPNLPTVTPKGSASVGLGSGRPPGNVTSSSRIPSGAVVVDELPPAHECYRLGNDRECMALDNADVHNRLPQRGWQYVEGPVYLYDGVGTYSCCYRYEMYEMYEGRPLLVGGLLRHASLSASADWNT